MTQNRKQKKHQTQRVERKNGKKKPFYQRKGIAVCGIAGTGILMATLLEVWTDSATIGSTWSQASASGLESSQREEKEQAGKAGGTMADLPEAELVAERETETESESESETGTENESEPVRWMEPESEWEPETEWWLESESEWEPETEWWLESESEWEAETEWWPESESESGHKSETEQWTELESESGHEPETEQWLESEKESESESDPENESEHDRESEWETEAESESETESEAESEAESEVESEAESETESESEGWNESEQEAESETGTEAQKESDRMEAESNLEQIGPSESETPEEDSREPGDLPSTDPVETDPISGDSTETDPSDVPGETNPWPDNTAETDPPQRETSPSAPVETNPPETAATERKQEKIRRGEDYEIVGTAGAWYRDEKDHLWVRAGSSLSIETKASSGFGSGPAIENLQQDGTLTFSLKKTDEQGNVFAESEIKQEAYYVDGEVPQAEVTVSGNRQNGIVYASQISAQIVIVPDGKSGLKSAAYTILGCQEDGTLLEQPGEKGWTDCPGGRALELQEEGCYQIYVRTEDHVGNVAFAKSSIVCVDTTPPELTIEGAGDKSANSGTVRLTISSHDSHYKQGSMEVSVAGVNRGKSPVTVRQEESGDGAVIEYLDFPREQEYDDIYSVSVSAEDTAGNRAEKKLEFSVNRYGSVYDLSEETKQSLQEYYLSEAQPITFYETNIDYVGESRIYCRRDGDLQALKQGRDYEVTLQGEEDTWKQYQYTIPAEYFEKEGVYEVLLTSNDRASNSSDTKMQEKQVAFVLDWSEPKCTISGIAQRQVYETSALTACLTPHDNIGIRTMQVYLNSELLQETETPKENETVKVELQKSDAWQTLEVYVRDLAGNEYWSDEIPVYINTKTEQVPEYQKERSSARELAQGKLVSTRKSAAGNRRKTSTGTDRTADGTKLIKTESAGASKTEKAAASPSRKLEGLLILGIGFLMLIGTVISCLIGWGRRKK